MDYITRYESPLGGITLAANGALTGYAAGIDRKMQMTPIVIVETVHETSLQEPEQTTEQKQTTEPEQTTE